MSYNIQTTRIEMGYGGPRMILKGKKVIALGERDGVQGNSIVECVKSAGAEVVIEFTSCFV